MHSAFNHERQVPAVLVPLQGTRVVARPRPLSDEAIDVRVAAGSTIADIFFDAGMDPRFIRHMQCWLVAEDITKEPVHVPLDLWEKVRPKPGVTVTFRMAPQGGGGGQKGTLGIVLRAVVVVIAAIATWYAGFSGGPLAAAGLSGGSLAAGAAGVGAAVPLSGKLLLAGKLLHYRRD